MRTLNQYYFNKSGRSDNLTVFCSEVVISRRIAVPAFTSSSPIMIVRDIFRLFACLICAFKLFAEVAEMTPIPLRRSTAVNFNRFITGRFAEAGNKNLRRRYRWNSDILPFQVEDDSLHTSSKPDTRGWFSSQSFDQSVITAAANNSTLGFFFLRLNFKDSPCIIVQTSYQSLINFIGYLQNIEVVL